MKKLSTTLMALGLLAMPLFAEIKVNDNLTLEGFVDMSATFMDDGNANELGFSLDQAEVDFMYKFSDLVSAQVDLEASSNDGSMADNNGPVVPGFTAFAEQGFVTVMPVKGLSIMGGRFLSSSGFETEEPTGLFQYSGSKNLDANPLYGHYQNGVAVKFAQPMFSVYGSAVTNVWTYNGADTDLEYPGFEVQGALMPVEGLTVKTHYLVQTYNDNAPLHLGDPQHVINTWALYAAGMVTVGGEFNYAIDFAMDNDDDGTPDVIDNGLGWIGMVNFSFGKPGLTLRYSGVKWDEEDVADTEATVAPNVAISDNLSLIAEYKYEINNEIHNGALEALYMF